jgi:cysteine desulfurase family protein (TIGR01976 family)
MTTLNFALSRAATRDLRPGDEIVVTALDHDGNVAPWLELARDRELVVKFAGIDDECRVDVADIERQLTERTRIVAFPLASNMLGTIADTPAIAALAHEAGALAWGDAVHYAAHVPIDVAALGLDVLLCSSYKFYGPHLGLAYVKEDVAEGWRPYKARPAPDAPPGRRFETGTQPHELLAGFIAAVEYIESVGWEAIHQHERELGERFLASLPEHCRLYGPNRMDKRVSTFSFTVDGVAPAEVAAALGRWDIAVGHGDFYAVEIARRLGLPDGVVRAGLVHYNTDEEVDRLLGGLARLA